MEEWQDIPGFEGRYQVSTLGRVRSLRGRWGLLPSPRILHQRPDTKGYPQTGLSIGHATVSVRRVHELVLTSFCGPMPAGLLRRHLNDVKTDNRLENLVYGTGLENTADRKRNYTSYHRGTRRTA